MDFEDSPWNIFYVKFGDLTTSVFEMSCRKTDTQTNGGENLITPITVGVCRTNDVRARVSATLAVNMIEF